MKPEILARAMNWMLSLTFTLVLLVNPAALPAQNRLPAAPPAPPAPAAFDRLPADLLDVTPPSSRVSGAPGQMRVLQRECRSLPANEVRRRIVDVAVQEWAYFGFPVVDETNSGLFAGGGRGGRRGRPGGGEAARVAASIAGYWASTPDGSWILERQNRAWNGPAGEGARWSDPWSAAFISWVMCEAGIAASNQFQRAIAHHTYIDQAIRARDGSAAQAAFMAYDSGEAAIAPGDLLCAGRRPAYQSIAERRRQIGVGAQTHCDVVVSVDAGNARILAIGGNVRGAVSLKLLPAAVGASGNLRPSAAAGGRAIFAHLKLRSGGIEAAALGSTPTIQAISCTPGVRVPTGLAAIVVTAAPRNC